MVGYRLVVFALSFVCTVLFGALSLVAAHVPERSPDGQTLRVPAEQQTLGVFAILTQGLRRVPKLR